MLVPNPFNKVAGISGSIGSSAQVALNQLLNPVPLLSTMTRHDNPLGKNQYDALLAKAGIASATVSVCCMRSRIPDCSKTQRLWVLKSPAQLNIRWAARIVRSIIRLPVSGSCHWGGRVGGCVRFRKPWMPW